MTIVVFALTLSSLLAVGTPELGVAISTSKSGAVTLDPGATGELPSGPGPSWVAPHAETLLWSAAGPQAEEIGPAHRWAPLEVIGQATDGRLPVRDPGDGRRGWVDVADVGPIDPTLAGGADVPPIGRPVVWSGPASVTMYTCVELGGCRTTASGLQPQLGMVAVDPSVIPLGSTVWIQGLGMFLAADTGSLVRGTHLDVFGSSYQEAMAWGIQERSVLVFAPQ